MTLLLYPLFIGGVLLFCTATVRARRNSNNFKHNDGHDNGHYNQGGNKGGGGYNQNQGFCGFDENDATGEWGFRFTGQAGSDLDIPFTAVGQFSAEGGKVTALTRTLNVGGGVVVDSERSTGQGSVNKDGTAQIWFCTHNEVRSGGSFYPRYTFEVYEAVITSKWNEVIEFELTDLYIEPKGGSMDSVKDSFKPHGENWDASGSGSGHGDHGDHHGDHHEREWKHPSYEYEAAAPCAEFNPYTIKHQGWRRQRALASGTARRQDVPAKCSFAGFDDDYYYNGKSTWY